MAEAFHEDDVEVFPIDLDRETLSRLVRLSRAVDNHPRKVASSLLHDILRDDEFENLMGILPNGKNVN